MSRKLMRRVLAFEGLETRRVLASSVSGGVELVEGVLTVNGTHKNDRIVVSVVGELGDQVSVQFNKTSYQCNLADVESLHVNGNNGNDRIWVSQDFVLDTVLDGGKGNDWIWGGGGADHMVGGAGHDRLFGGDGDDELHGDAGHDRLSGGLGVDHLFGEAGKDRLRGGDGDDFLWGGDGKDHLYGDAGDDELYGEGDKDLVYGGDGNDWLDGGDGKDKLWGGEGDDSIKGGLGNDHLNGGAGVNLLDGDEGRNKLWNGTEHDFESQPEEPEDPPVDPPGDPGTVQYVTSLSDSSYSATIVFTDDGTEMVLTLNVTGPVGEFVVFMIEGNVWAMFELYDGTYSGRFSNVHDDAGEEPFPDGAILMDGAEVSIGSLLGPLNMSVASAS